MPRNPSKIQSGAIGTRNPANPALALSPLSGQQQRGPALARQHFADRRLNQIQSAAVQATSQATASDDAACNVLVAVSFTANTPLTLQHALGRTWTSYRVENVLGSFAAFVALPQGGNNVKGPADAYSIVVEANANCIADLRVW